MSMVEKKENQGYEFQNKSKFVLDILDYSLKKKIDDETKERLVCLIGKEIEKTGNVGDEIIERLARIEGMIATTSPSKKDEIKVGFGKLHRPKETKAFLSLFNNSKGLKYLTHKFNEGKREYNSFIELCKEEFKKGQEDYPNVSDKVVKRIYQFAFSEKPEWYLRKGNDKIYPEKGWSEPTFMKWYKKDDNIHPGLDAKWNNEMIIPFKESIEVRAGNLRSIIEESLELGFGDSKTNFTINISNKLDEAEFYTDVDMFKLALFHVFSTIREKAGKNFCFEISVDYVNETLDDGEFKKIIITHINSEASKNSNDPVFAKGDLMTIKNNLWKLCNYEIQAKFPDGLKKRIFSTDNYSDYVEYVKANKSLDIDENEIKGFSHILKFY